MIYVLSAYGFTALVFLGLAFYCWTQNRFVSKFAGPK